MSQESLFDATAYMARAYDNLALAYSCWELQEIAMLKAAVLRGYVSLKVISSEQLELEQHCFESETL